MQSDYLSRLSQSVRVFIEEVESAAGIPIEVIPNSELNTDGPVGNGKLKVVIEAHHVRIIAPTNGYFPNGGVRHEVLHVHRFHVEGVPRLALSESETFAPDFERSLVQVDNKLEHLIIVPIELRHHPERQVHWEAVMSRFWKDDIKNMRSDLDRRIDVCLHWTFMQHVMRTSSVVDAAHTVIKEHNLQSEAELFCDKLLPLLADKLTVVQMFFNWFSDIPRERAALEYLSSITGNRLLPISG